MLKHKVYAQQDFGYIQKDAPFKKAHVRDGEQAAPRSYWSTKYFVWVVRAKCFWALSPSPSTPTLMTVTTTSAHTES